MSLKIWCLRIILGQSANSILSSKMSEISFSCFIKWSYNVPCQYSHAGLRQCAIGQRQCCLQLMPQPNNKTSSDAWRVTLTPMGRLRRSRTHHARRDVHRGARTRVCEQISSSKCYQYRCIGSDARLGSDSAYRPWPQGMKGPHFLSSEFSIQSLL